MKEFEYFELVDNIDSDLSLIDALDRLHQLEDLPKRKKTDHVLFEIATLELQVQIGAFADDEGIR